jgi:hypothetical protein
VPCKDNVFGSSLTASCPRLATAQWSASGPSEENPASVRETGLSKSDVSAMITAWAKNLAAVQKAMVDAGGFNQQLMYLAFSTYCPCHNLDLSS